MDSLLIYNEYYFGRIYRNIYRAIGLNQFSVIYPNELTLPFIQSILNKRYNGNVIGFTVDEKPCTGGLNGEIYRVRLTWEQQPGQSLLLPTSVIFKSSIDTWDKLKFSYEHNSARESDFYKYHLSLYNNKINKNNNINNNEMTYPFIPIVYYSNKSYGGSYSMIVQDLSPPTDNGDGSYIVASLAMGNQCWGVPKEIDISKFDISWIVERCFDEVLKLNTSNWRNTELVKSPNNQSMNWLKNLDYYNGIGKDKYEAYYQVKLKSTWDKVCLPLINKLDSENKGSLQHVQLYIQVVNEYFESFTKWDNFQSRIDINKPTTAFTLIHGDYHAGNVMIPNFNNKDGNDNNKEKQVYFLDYSEIGIGDPFEDLSQFVISNCTIEFRRANEERLFRGYWNKLVQSPKVDSTIFTFDYSYNLYKRGGMFKWIWFNILLCEMVPEFGFTFYFNQLSTFMFDHYNQNLLK